MGLLRTGIGTVTGVLSDQWKEYFYCDALGADVLAVKGRKRVSGGSNNGLDNIISNGSVIAVADGQCMMIVEQGKVVDVCAEPGEYIYDISTEPSLFAGGNLSSNIKQVFQTIGKRFTFGGVAPKDQRVYYFNTKEILDNKFGTATPIDFRVVDSRVGIDRDVRLRVNGTYSYRISDPILFYTNVCGNVAGSYERSELDGQLKTEFVSALMPAVGRMSELELRPNQLMNHTKELRDYLNQELTAEWAEKRGLSVVSVALGGVTLSEEDAELLRQDQRAATYRDPGMAAGMLATAQAEAMRTAAGNTGGAMTGFMGMGMAMNAGANTQNLYAMQQQQQQQQAAQPQPAPAQAPAADSWICPGCGKTVTGKFCPECGAKKPEAKPADSWICPECGKTATGKFCPECGTARPADNGWVCTCGAHNTGRFCSECGAKKPEAAPRYRCDKCGWVPEDPTNPPKFCPECGNRFDENDIVR